MEPGWPTILPPLVALALAVLLREVYVSLLVGVFCGAMIMTRGNPADALVNMLEEHIVGQIADPDHLKTILFTLLLGAMIGVMSGSGGTAAMVARLVRFTTSRRRGMVLTWLAGLVVFFDDYANTLLVGSSMRPLADRLRISREKLAFLIDATAAPVAGLAIVSTWVGFEINQIEDGFQAAGISVDARDIFLRTIPYRFYPLVLIAFVFLIAITERDFGPMRRSERAILSRKPERPNSRSALAADAIDLPAPHTASKESGDQSDEVAKRTPANALIPIGVLLICVTIGFVMAAYSKKGDVDPFRILLVSSFLAAASAFLCALWTKSLSLRSCTQASLDGALTMFPAVIILVLAWSIAGICDGKHLGTAQFIVNSVGHQLAPPWLPTLAFVLSGIVSLATGSSFATMGLLLPMFIPLTMSVLQADAAGAIVDPNHPIMLASIGAILAGAIFGDHCSPISDTTVLSSAAADCDHLLHVATQMPYAVTVALIAVCTGCIPAGFEVAPAISIPTGFGVALAAVIMFGRRPDGAN